MTTDQQQKAEQLIANSLKDNPDVFNLPDSERSIDNPQERYAITRRHRITLFGEFLQKAKDELKSVI